MILMIRRGKVLSLAHLPSYSSSKLICFIFGFIFVLDVEIYGWTEKDSETKIEDREREDRETSPIELKVVVFG